MEVDRTPIVEKVEISSVITEKPPKGISISSCGCFPHWFSEFLGEKEGLRSLQPKETISTETAVELIYPHVEEIKEQHTINLKEKAVSGNTAFSYVGGEHGY